MLHHDTRKELLKKTVTPTKALENAIQMEMGAQNQQKIYQNLNIATNSVTLSTFSKPAIATRFTNQLVKISLGTHLYTKTTSTLAFVPIVANGGATTTVKYAPRIEKSAITVV